MRRAELGFTGKKYVELTHLLVCNILYSRNVLIAPDSCYVGYKIGFQTAPKMGFGAAKLTFCDCRSAFLIIIRNPSIVSQVKQI